MLRVVFDTNLFVSGLLVNNGLPAQALDAWRAHRFLLITSPAIMAEISATLRYESIRRKYGVTDEDITQLLELLAADALVVPGNEDDEMVLACAVDGQANAVVSGDQHLLALGVFRGIDIITVRQFMERLSSV